MYSGTRATDLYNTCLNLAYRNVAKKLASEYFNTTVTQEFAVHHGDDYYLSCESVSGALTTWLVMRAMGLAMQPTKQVIGGNVGEFLRIL